MKKLILFAVTIVVMAGAIGVSAKGKITICHYPPGNPEARHTKTISEDAWPAHEAHGDTKGPCPSEQDDPVEETSGPVYNYYLPQIEKNSYVCTGYPRCWEW